MLKNINVLPQKHRSVINPEFFVEEVKKNTGLKVEIIGSVEKLDFL